jgi:hypothetical protein
MQPIRDQSTWLRMMHRKLRWSARRPTILAVRGAELVRVRPSEVAKPPPARAPKTIEEQEHSAQADTHTPG